MKSLRVTSSCLHISYSRISQILKSLNLFSTLIVSVHRFDGCGGKKGCLDEMRDVINVNETLECLSVAVFFLGQVL